MCDEVFALRLVRLRKQAGFTQAVLAERAGVLQSQVSMLENGTRMGGQTHAEALYGMARALGVSMEYLLTGSERPVRHRRIANAVSA